MLKVKVIRHFGEIGGYFFSGSKRYHSEIWWFFIAVFKRCFFQIHPYPHQLYNDSTVRFHHIQNQVPGTAIRTLLFFLHHPTKP
jgi:hypothetical protein